MKKFAMLILVCGLAVSANAATYQLADYVASPDFDGAVTFTGDISGYPAIPISDTGAALGWYLDGRYEHSQLVQVGALADSGTQCMTLLSRSEYGPAGVMALPNEYLAIGDTWEFKFKAKRDDVAVAWPGLAADIQMFFLVDGGMYGLATIPAASLTTDWQEFTYSMAYDGPYDCEALGWNMVIRAAPTANFRSVLIDSVSAVPEPATMSLLGLGGVISLIRRKK